MQKQAWDRRRLALPCPCSTELGKGAGPGALLRSRGCTKIQ